MLIAELQVRSTSLLSPSLAERAPRVESAFRALAALNESGQLDGRDLWNVARLCFALTDDAQLDEAEADRLVETIRDLVVRKTAPQAL